MKRRDAPAPKRRRLAVAAVCAVTLAGAATGASVLALRWSASRGRLQSHQRMLAALRDIQARTPDEHWLLGDKEARLLRAFVGAPPRGLPPAELCKAYYRLGHAEQVQGREAEALAAFTRAYSMLPGLKEDVDPEGNIMVVLYLGVSYLRIAESQNCCQRHTADSCLMPIQGGGVHTLREGSTKAIQCFLEVLKGTGDAQEAHLQARWLLNIAYMTLGEYPDRVPPEHLIPPAAFASDEPFPRFRNVATERGVGVFANAGGAIGDDMDNDGDIDLLLSSSHTSGPMHYFRNDGAGSFTDRTGEAGLTGLLGGLNMVQADYNNDGNVDVLLLRGGWLFEDGRHPNSLLRNGGDATFVDVAFACGFGEEHFPTQTASWADYDNDGDLDIYIGNESTDRVRAPCQLFKNGGDETFADVARAAGVTNDGFTKSVIWGDYDNDGWADIYVGNLTSANRLYHNDGRGRFTDVATQLGVTLPGATFPTWFWDEDNDGALDIAAFAYAGDIAQTAAAALGRPFQSELPCLYHGDGKGGFVEIGRQRNLVKPLLPMGANFGDLDGDGYLDFYLGTGDPNYMNLMPNTMYRNRAGQGFADVTTGGGFGHLQKGHAIVFADFDNDGDQDVFEEMGGAFTGDRAVSAFYENPGFGSRWISVKLVGVQSNRSAIGARLRIVVLEEGKERTIYKHVNSGGTFGGNPLRQNVGLGKASAIVALEVLWPATRTTQTFRDVPLDSWIEIVEGRDGWRATPPARPVATTADRPARSRAPRRRRRTRARGAAARGR